MDKINRIDKIYIKNPVNLVNPVKNTALGNPMSGTETWIGVYTAATPGADIGDNATVLLDFESEVQPDAFLRLETRFGGQSRITRNDYTAAFWSNNMAAMLATLQEGLATREHARFVAHLQEEQARMQHR